MAEPIIASPGQPWDQGDPLMNATGHSFSIHEWSGSGPPLLHVHYEDDEAWHVLKGSIRFRFSDREVEASAGTTVFVPAGVPHTYQTADARYLIVLTPCLERLIEELHCTPDRQAQAEVYRKYRSELLE